MYRQQVDRFFGLYPEVFPVGFEQGYKLHDKKESNKIKGLVLRRVKLKNGAVYGIVPSHIMPYLSGHTQEVSKGLLLRHWAVPYEVIALVLGKNAMYWERQEEALGRISLVGSLCKKQGLPAHLAADEKITFWNGKEVYIALTAGRECVLGAELSMSEDIQGLQSAYGVFKQEATTYQKEYTPLSVNLDGWQASNAAWRKLFPTIVIILCFLHAFLKIRDIGKVMKEQFQQVSSKVWDCYREKTKEDFTQSLMELQVWAEANLKAYEKVKEKIKDLCVKSARFALAYEFDTCYRTSNQIDRPMNILDRYLYQMRYFRGNREAANQKVRAWAMIYNFVPFSQRVQNRKDNPKKKSRFEDHNGFVYHQDWLQNLIIASSLNGSISRHIKR